MTRLIVRFHQAAVLSGLVLLGGCGGGAAAGGGGASASAEIKVESGFFFGHDLRQQPSLVYVLDLSGSMKASSGSVVENVGNDAAGAVAGGIVGGFAGRRAGAVTKSRIQRLKKKIEKVKLHLIASLQGLPEGAQFNIIMFSDGVQKLSPSMIPATGGTKLAVSAFVDRLEGGGSTNMYKAVEAALYSGATHIILLTDGLPTSSSPEAILDLVARHNGSAQIVVSTVGVGGDQAYEFLNNLAQANGGQFTSYN